MLLVICVEEDVSILERVYWWEQESLQKSGAILWKSLSTLKLYLALPQVERIIELPDG